MESARPVPVTANGPGDAADQNSAIADGELPPLTPLQRCRAPRRLHPMSRFETAVAGRQILPITGTVPSTADNAGRPRFKSAVARRNYRRIRERCRAPRTLREIVVQVRGCCTANYHRFTGAAQREDCSRCRGSRPRLPHGKLPPLHRCRVPRTLRDDRGSRPRLPHDFPPSAAAAIMLRSCRLSRRFKSRSPDGKLLAAYRISTDGSTLEFRPPMTRSARRGDGRTLRGAAITVDGKSTVRPRLDLSRGECFNSSRQRGLVAASSAEPPVADLRHRATALPRAASGQSASRVLWDLTLKRTAWRPLARPLSCEDDPIGLGRCRARQTFRDAAVQVRGCRTANYCRLLDFDGPAAALCFRT